MVPIKRSLFKQRSCSVLFQARNFSSETFSSRESLVRFIMGSVSAERLQREGDFLTNNQRREHRTVSANNAQTKQIRPREHSEYDLTHQVSRSTALFAEEERPGREGRINLLDVYVLLGLCVAFDRGVPPELPKRYLCRHLARWPSPGTAR